MKTPEEARAYALDYYLTVRQMQRHWKELLLIPMFAAMSMMIHRCRRIMKVVRACRKMWRKQRRRSYLLRRARKRRKALLYKSSTTIKWQAESARFSKFISAPSDPFFGRAAIEHEVFLPAHFMRGTFQPFLQEVMRYEG